MRILPLNTPDALDPEKQAKIDALESKIARLTQKKSRGGLTPAEKKALTGAKRSLGQLTRVNLPREFSRAAVEREISDFLGSNPMLDPVDAVLMPYLEGTAGELTDQYLPDQFGVEEDYFDNDPVRKMQATKAGIPVSDDHKAWKQVLDGPVIDRLVDLMIGGKKARMDYAAKQLVEMSETSIAPPQTVLAAWLHLRYQETDRTLSQQDVVPAQDLRPGQGFTIHGDPFRVVADENLNRVIEHAESGFRLNLDYMDQMPVDQGSRQSADQIDSPFSLAPKHFLETVNSSSMPQSLRDTVASWDYISKSPYSHSYYSKPGKSWSHTPEGIRRVSDHWNFTSQGPEIHAKTDKPVENNTHWTLAEYREGTWNVINSVPADDALLQAWRDKKEKDNNRRYKATRIAVDKKRLFARVTKTIWSSGRNARKIGEEVVVGRVVRASPASIWLDRGQGEPTRFAREKADFYLSKQAAENEQSSGLALFDNWIGEYEPIRFSLFNSDPLYGQEARLTGKQEGMFEDLPNEPMNESGRYGFDPKDVAKALMYEPNPTAAYVWGITLAVQGKTAVPKNRVNNLQKWEAKEALRAIKDFKKAASALDKAEANFRAGKPQEDFETGSLFSVVAWQANPKEFENTAFSLFGTGATGNQVGLFSNRGNDEPKPDTPQPAAQDEPESTAPAGGALFGGQTPGRIEDFGEKIGGARKDYAENYRDQRRSALELGLAAEPLGKTWPEPDYQKLIDAGADLEAVAFARAARDEVPNKPRSAWKLSRWVNQVTGLRDFEFDILGGKYDVAEVRRRVESVAGLTKTLNRMRLYQRLGHGQTLKGVTLESGRYTVFKGDKMEPPKVIWSVEKRTGSRRSPEVLAYGDNPDQAIDNFAKHAEHLLSRKRKNHKTKFIVYRYRVGGQANQWWIGKKIRSGVHADLKRFDSSREAADYLQQNYDEVSSLWDAYRSVPNARRSKNAPRVGADHRRGVDVTPDQFSKAFGFRGVEFGNYVEQSRRQSDLNQSYDALMDLAGVLGIAPKALSLNGELVLAFGARGRGGKGAPAAHYEPVKVVINLTKHGGPGSLAHEWWHGVDNYFARQGGRNGADSYASERAGLQGIRPEMAEAFKGITDGIRSTRVPARSAIADRARSKPYFAQGREMSARMFEDFVRHRLDEQGYSNDYLVNIGSPEAFDALMEGGVALHREAGDAGHRRGVPGLF
ncbi:MAG: LPD5 domain-containing protein [Planctomycetota bacterium]